MKKVLLLFATLFALGQNAFAYNFSAVAPSGQTLYYNVSGGSAVVTCPGSHSAYSGFTKPTGNLVIPNSVTNGGTTYAVTSIGNHAFNGCTGLTSVTIPDEVTNIGENSFYNCSSLASITIPNGVTSIGNQAFWGCSSLVSVMFNATHCSSVGNSFSNAAFRYCSNLTNFTFGDSVTIIPAYLCGGNSSLTSVTIPNSVVSIGAAAFASCTGMTSVAIPNLVDSIANSAFSDCTGLTSITISDGLSSIGDFAFYNCTSLNSVTIPNSVTSIGRQAFYQCGLDSLIVGSALVTIGIEAFLGDTLSYLCYNCPANVLNKIYKYRLATVIIGDSVTSIGSSAFSGCTSLTSVTIGNGITSVGANAFYNCIGLTSVSIPDLVTSIGQYAFYGCSSLTSVSLGNSITSIGDQAFYNCNALNSVTIPNSVTYIGFCTFENCSGLTAVTIGNSVTNINSRAFKNCSGLTSVTIPNSVATIGYDAFRGCASLTTVVYNADSCTQAGELNYNGGIDPAFGHYSNITTFTFGENVKVIPNYLCYGLSGLTSVTIPDSVTWIGFKTFYNCSNLDSVILLPITAPLLAYNDVFQNNSVTRKFYIPCGSYNSYYNGGSGWSNYRNYLQEPEPDYSITVGVNNTAYGSVTNTPVTCAEQTIISAIANNHYHFDHWSNGSAANPDTIILTSNLAVTAFFAPDQYTVTGVSSNNAKGSVSGSATVDYLSTVTLTATANDGYHFTQWQDGNTQNPRTITVTGNATYTAHFEANAPTQYTITATSANPTMGTVSGGGSYAAGATATLTASANTGYHFVRWNDNNTQNPRTITVTGNATYTAYFDANAPVNPATVTATISEITSTSAHAEIVKGQHTSYFYYFYGPQSAFTQNGLTTDEAIINYVNQNYDASERNYNNVSGYMNGLTPSTEYLLVVVPYNSNDEVGTVCRTQFTTLSSAGTATMTATISEITATSAHAEIVMGQQTSYFYLIYAPQSVFTQNGLTTDESIISYVNQNYGTSDRNYNNVSGYMNDLTPNTTYMLVVVPYNSNDEVGTITRKQFTTLNNNGIEDVGEEEYAVSSQDGRLVISGAEGKMVSVYSLSGRCIYSASATGTTVIDIPASGTYLVKIGHHPARKVVVIR